MTIKSIFFNLISNIKIEVTPLTISFGAISILLTAVWYWARDEAPYAGFPIVGKENWEWLNTMAKMRFVNNARSILRKGLEDHQGPFQVFSTHGPVIILPPSMIDEIRNDDRLSFLKATGTLFMPRFSGLEAFHTEYDTHRIFLAVIKQSLTQSLASIVPDMAKGTYAMLNDLFPTTTKDWMPIHLAPLTPLIAARLSAKVFVGEPLCRDSDWLNISVTYTINAMRAILQMRQWPSFLRPLVQYFLPEFGVIRTQIRMARRLIEPELTRRQKMEEHGEKLQQQRSRPADALDWMNLQARGMPFDKVLAQMLMSFVAIHTTSNTLLALMYDIVSHMELIEPLRQEVVEALREEGGWTKAALHKMKLLDSCMKESQRLHPMSAILMDRQVTSPVTLSDGTLLPKNAIIGVPTFSMSAPDSSFFGANPCEFDGRRFLDRRKDNDIKWQFVATSSEHYGFGHGKQACPGRFFASNEIKIIVAHMLLMFDWKFAEGEEPKSVSLVESDFVPDEGQRIWARPRVPEVNLKEL
ncbi:putative cytochrome P450 monooxygenase [Macrophomina phaseolina]|uniref:Cytochrome P450 monooxygenase n=1 Tax=Macrophomina phaseolina TaxID=35725 RepID=A0ABQ8FQF2_9PEZI|nr:putative cytochrome P450 monooxygenase [Macrophomina phaseolina]